MSEFVPFGLYTGMFFIFIESCGSQVVTCSTFDLSPKPLLLCSEENAFSYSAPLHPGVSVGTSNSRSKPQCHFIYTVTEPKKISNSANCMSYSILMWRCLTFIIWVSIWLTLLFPGHIFCSWMAICKNSLNTILTSLTVSVWNHICSKLFPSRIVIFYIHIFDFWYVVCKIHLSASSKQTLPGLDFHHSSPRPHLKGDILESRNA